MAPDADTVQPDSPANGAKKRSWRLRTLRFGEVIAIIGLAITVGFQACEARDRGTENSILESRLEQNKRALAQRDKELDQKDEVIRLKATELDQKVAELTQRENQHQEAISLERQKLELEKKEFFIDNAAKSVKKVQERLKALEEVNSSREQQPLDILEREIFRRNAVECHRKLIVDLEYLRFSGIYFGQKWDELRENVDCAHKNINKACPESDSLCQDVTVIDYASLPSVRNYFPSGVGSPIAPQN